MKSLKRIIVTFLCLVLLFSITVIAAPTTTITISNATVMPGETTTIDIRISNNPGIMAMTFCITYDSDSLEYVKYTKGYLSKYTVKDHPNKGHIIFVNDESSDVSKDGTIISIEFKVKDNATPGKHIISLANNNRDKYGSKLHNSFSNSNLEYIVPVVNQGFITVGETCENAGHKYGEWETTTPADCTTTGIREHSCIRCQFTEEEEIPFAHDFELVWTVDKAATPTEDGIMSRHCKNCNATTDQFTFTYEEVEDSEEPDDNTSSETPSQDESSSESNSSENVSNESASSESSSNEENTQSDTSSNNTTSNTTNKPSTKPNKAPINNTVGSKNPQSAIENIKDYQENVKPNIGNLDELSNIQDSNKENPTITTGANDSDLTSSNTNSSDNDKNQSNSSQEKDTVTNNLSASPQKAVRSPLEITILVISAIISIAVIAFAVLFIIRNKNKK